MAKHEGRHADGPLFQDLNRTESPVCPISYYKDKQCSESLWLKMSTTISHISIHFNPEHYPSRNLIRDEQEKLFWFNCPANN